MEKITFKEFSFRHAEKIVDKEVKDEIAGILGNLDFCFFSHGRAIFLSFAKCTKLTVLKNPFSKNI